ncbi:MAG: hypothetical protein ACFFEJ_14345 [Candidatus Thorarchaeota archaeon]
MSADSSRFVFKEIDEMLVAGYRAPVKQRSEIPPRFTYLREVCNDIITGPGMVIFRFDTGIEEGFDAEVAFPVSQVYEDDVVKSYKLESVTAMSYSWKGPKTELSAALREIRDYANSRGMPHGLSPREIYHKDPMGDDLDVEILATFHDWNRRFSDGLESILGPEIREEVMKGYDKITPHTEACVRGQWAIDAIMKLDSIATEEQKYEVISGCAHVRPIEEILKLKAVYDRNKNVDEFLEVWGNSLPFIVKPYREGNIIYQTKPPADPEAYKKATTQEEIIRAACFCPIVKATLDRMPRTFCYCGAGWSRQLYETVFGEKLKIEIAETVIDGGKLCKYAIHLPSHLTPE